MTWLWAVFTFLNLWWVAAFIVIAFQGQRTDAFKKTIIYTSLLSASVTAILKVLMDQGIIRFI